jgi:hypothetical protein
MVQLRLSKKLKRKRNKKTKNHHLEVKAAVAAVKRVAQNHQLLSNLYQRRSNNKSL